MTSQGLRWELRDPQSDVLIVANTWPSEDRPAYGIFVKRQVSALRRAGLHCDVVSLPGYLSPWNYLRAAIWFALSSYRLRRRYKLIHAHAGETALVARCAIGVTVIASYQGDDLLGDPSRQGGLTLQSRVRSLLIRQHSRLLAATITKSAEMESALPSHMARHNKVIPNGVDSSLFSPGDKADARARLRWQVDEPVALFCATKPETPRKRLWLAQAACAEAERELGHRVRLEVAGAVPPEQMPTLMNAADCLLMTSSLEGSPNTVKEALMCNLPIVATPSGDISTLLKQVEPSWLCEPDASALAAALVACLHSGRRSNGSEVAAWLTDESISQRILSLYAAVAPVALTDDATASRSGASSGSDRR